MNPRDLDRLTEQERRQQKQWQNWYLGQRRRRVLANAQRKEELGQEREVAK